MSQQCGVCNKSVYPMEQIKYFDMVLHKGCFKCSTCSATLNLKNCKSHEKKLYCNVHYPQPSRYTTTPDSVELKRVTQNSQVISNVKYHEEFERSKGMGRRTSTELPENGGISNQQPQPMRTVPATITTRTSTSGDSRGSYPPQNGNRGSAATVEQPSHRTTDATRLIDTVQQYSGEERHNPIMETEVPAQEGEGNTYRAVYDYQANDNDEVSFLEGDIILNGVSIDDGWMTGTVERTGESGMLPSNYVERYE